MFLLLAFLYVNVLIWSVSSQECTYFDYDYWNYDDFEYNVVSAQNQFSEDLNQFGLSFWMNYRPLDDENTLNINVEGVERYFVFSYQSYDDEEYVIYFYIEILPNDQKIKHNMQIQIQNEWIDSVLVINSDYYDGDWYFVSIYVDQKNEIITISYYSSSQERLYIDQKHGSLLLFENMKTVTGGHPTIQRNSDTLVLLNYPGIILSVVVTSENLFTDLENILQYCPKPSEFCDSFTQTLVDGNMLFKSESTIFIQSYLKLGNNNYVIQGWVKQDKYQQKNSRDSLLLRVTVNQQYLNNNIIGDRVLYILYSQSNTHPKQNGFSLQTYSYDFPYKPDQYQSTSDYTIFVQDEKYQTLLTQWHYFQFKMGLDQPVYLIYFPSLDITEEYQWQKPINHFKNTYLYFSIGGDDFIEYSFLGQLSDWEFLYFCDEPSISFSPICHYSCQTCSGYSANGCLTCQEDTHRIYSSDLQSCICSYGYIDIDDDPICQNINEFSGIFEQVEVEIKCDKQGYHQCDKQISCEFGYFQVQNQCIKCPYFGLEDNDFLISCGDCFLYPDIFSQSLNCTFKLLAYDYFSTYNQSIYNYLNFQVYQLQSDSYQLKYLKGYQDGNTCKYGYYQYNMECMICPDNCIDCEFGDACIECDIGYRLNTLGQCIPCTQCQRCQTEEGEEICLRSYYCIDSYYWDYSHCLPCGNHCLKCSPQQCFTCSEQYFITFDKFNCAQCPIKNCKYCFQYIEQPDKSIQTTFDLNFSNFNILEIKVGCALCNDNYFFSLITLQCEPTPSGMEDCEFGVVDEQYTNVCIISETRLDALQISQCNDNYCTSCINNYSPAIPQFCTVCSYGYYPTILTGKCKKCPTNCLTCAEQNTGLQDYWKLSILPFYKYFIDQQGTHPFEKFAANYKTLDFEIICLSCPQNKLLVNNICYEGCDDNCLDCRPIFMEDTEDYEGPSYIPRCYKCKSDQFSLQKSVDPQQIGRCLECPQYCNGCFPRTAGQITKLNPFFNQSSQYIKYSYICFNSQKIQNLNIGLIPKFIVPNVCQTFDKCENQVKLIFYLYCDMLQFNSARYEEENYSMKARYQIPYYIAVYNSLNDVQNDQIYQYLNKMKIQKMDLQFQIRWEEGRDPCKITYQQLPSKCFSLQQINLNFYSNYSYKVPFFFRKKFTIYDFERISFSNIEINLPSDKNYVLYSEIYFLNQFYPITLIFKDCEFYQENQELKVKFQLSSNKPQTLILENIILKQLNIENSLIFNFQPTSEYSDSTQTIFNLNIIDSNFTNTSIFYYSAISNSLNYLLNFTNVNIQNTNFIKAFFINSTFKFDYDVGKVYFQNFHLENVNFFDDSIFFYLLSAQIFVVEQFTLTNVIFQQSSFLICNVFQIYEMYISSSIINQGQFISNNGSQSQIEQQNSKQIILSSLSFKNNIYNAANQLLFIIGDINLTCTNLILINNNKSNIVQGRFSQNYVSYMDSQIYIECATCIFKNTNIIRGIGLPELTLLNSKYLLIDKFQIQQEYFQRSLHSSFECVKQFIYLDVPFVLFISNYHKVLINDFTVQDLRIIDYSLLIFYGESQTDIIQSDIISITNSIFQNNLLLIVSEDRFSSLISIDTPQNTLIEFNNVKFLDNHLNQYQENTLYHSSTTSLINAKLGEVYFKQSEFIQNVLTNSSDSILFVLAKSLTIQNCNFTNQNIVSSHQLIKNLLIPKSAYIDGNVYNSFQILSNGGNGYFQINKLEIINTLVQNSIAVNGGGFYITSITTGTILIKNCSFKNTSTILNGYQLSAGGLLYIDSSYSSLDLQIYATSIYQSYSRTIGGVLYIEPSRSSNLIILDFLNVASVFSLQHSLLSYSPQKQISATSNLFINNSRFTNNEQEFNLFTEKISDLSLQNILIFQTENPLIYAQFSNFSMYNCTFESIHLAILIDIQQGINIYLESINIFNSSIFRSPIINLNLRTGIFFVMKGLNGIIIFKEIRLYDLNVFKSNVSYICNQNEFIYYDLLCPLGEININHEPIELNLNNNLTNQLECNLKQLYTVDNYYFSLIQLSELETNHMLIVQDLKLNQIYCDLCYYGLFSLQTFNSSKLSFDQIEIADNICGDLGCLSLLKSLDDIILALNYDQNIENFNQTIDVQAILTHSIFINNSAKYGGACFFTNIDILINNSLFLNNQATIQGGAIHYYSDQRNLIIRNSQIVKNKANVAGGLYLNNQQLERSAISNLLITDNQAQSFADNLFEAPRELHLSLKNNQSLENVNILSNSTTIIEQVKISPYYTLFSNEKTDVLLLPSGVSISNYQYFDVNQNDYISYNLTFRIKAYNSLGERIEQLDNSVCSITANKINKANANIYENSNSSNTNYLSLNEIGFNQQTMDYNLDDLIIFFDPFSNVDQYLQLAFKCNSLKIPYYNQPIALEPSNFITDYILILNLRTFQCQLGEYLNTSSGGCVQCDSSQYQYSVTLNTTKCSYKDDLKIKNIKPATIELREYYWRAFYYSEKIEYCFHLLANCEGGWIAGNPSCAIGHIGGLCEQCDLYNIKGQGYYSQNQSYQCSSCDQMEGNILNICFVILWTLISVFITVTSTIKMIEEFVFQLKLKPLGFHTILQTGTTSVLLKVFTNYLQIISSISSFQLSIPIGVVLAVRGVGNPIESMAFSLDCYLGSVSSIPIIYFRVIWGFLIAGIYIFLFFFSHLVLTLIQKGQMNITFISTTLIYIYIYLSPNLVSQLSFLISYRNISNEKWIAANVAYLYGTEQHRDWLLFFVAPTFFVIGILLPFFFWYIIYHHRLQLNTKKLRKVWGYLYNEYKLTTYYWETVKILQKEIIILVLIYYEDYVPIKACLIFFLLHIYSKLTSKYKPYYTGSLNNIDQLSTSICKISIIIAQSIYLAQDLDITEILWPFYFVLAIINFFFIFEMLSKIIFAYFNKLYEQIDKVKAIIQWQFPTIFNKYTFCQRLLRNTTERKQIVKYRYQQVRVYLIEQAKQIIEFKQKNNMGLVGNEQSQIYRLSQKTLGRLVLGQRTQAYL